MSQFACLPKIGRGSSGSEFTSTFQTKERPNKHDRRRSLFVPKYSYSLPSLALSNEVRALYLCLVISQEVLAANIDHPSIGQRRRKNPSARH
jgi:hypothetical protein